MNADYVNSIRRALRWLITASQVVLLIVALGCASSPNGAQKPASNARDGFDPFDPFSTGAATKAVEKAANEVTFLLDEFDVEELDAAVQDVRRVMRQVSQRLEAVPVGDIQSTSGDLTESMMMVRVHLEHMQLADAVQSVQTVAEGIDAKVKTLDIQRVNAVLGKAEDFVAGIQTEVANLSELLDRTIDNLGRQLHKAGNTIESLPVEALREDLDTLKRNLDSIDKATKSLESSLQRAGATLFAATVTLWMISLCALVWLVKLIRRRSA